MIGAIIGLLVGQDDYVPPKSTAGRLPRPNPAMLATVAAVHSIAFGTEPGPTLHDLRARHPSIAGMPGVSGFLRDEDFWAADVTPPSEGFVPWPIVAAWLCPDDIGERVLAMMEIAYPIPGDHFTSTMAVAETVRSMLDGKPVEEIAAALQDFHAMADTGTFPVAAATSAGLKAGLNAASFLEAVSPFSNPDLDYDRGNAAFVSGAVASLRFEIPGWGYVAANDLTEDVVQGGMDVFEALYADPSLGAARTTWKVGDDDPSETPVVVAEREVDISDERDTPGVDAEIGDPSPERPAGPVTVGIRSMLASLAGRLSLSRR